MDSNPSADLISSLKVTFKNYFSLQEIKILMIKSMILMLNSMFLSSSKSLVAVFVVFLFRISREYKQLIKICLLK